MSKVKFLIMLIILAMASACSDDDFINNEQKQEEVGFFSQDILKNGNKWVYWDYYINNFQENPDEVIYTGIVDSVEVVGQGEHNGISYSVVKTRRFNPDGLLISEKISHQRITPLTHWVSFSSDQYPENEEYGIVLHPGEDWEFASLLTFDPYGSAEMHLYETTMVNIDGTVYEVAPYNGIFIPNEEFPELISKTIEYNYNKDVGLVNYVCHFIFHPRAYGHRLKSFTPGD